MDKETERSFLDSLSRGLVSLPFDLKVLLEAVSDADLEHTVREKAAAAVVHIINPKDGNVDPPVRHDDVVDWLDSRWSALLKVVYGKKKIPMFVDDEEVGTFLYDEGMKFGTNYPISEKYLAGRVKQAQPIVDHLIRKRDQDKKKITSPA